MKIKNLTLRSRAFTSNVFLVSPENGQGRTVLVDAGGDPDIVDLIRRETDSIDAIVLTHTHRDHVDQLGTVKEAFDVDVWGYDTSFDGIDHELDDGDTFEMAGADFDVIYTPGHKNDHICLYGDSVLFSGDLVFAGGSFGRTDLEEGDREVLIESIEKLLEETDEIDEMHAGHQASTDDRVREQIEMSLKNARTF